MKFYLSSFRLGRTPDKLAELFQKGKKIAVICNSIDFETEDIRKEKADKEILWLSELGLEPKEIDLRKYFKANSDLAQEMENFDGCWIRGGNVFLLRRAYLQSHFDRFIKEKLKDNNFVYAGYSAGVCILSNDLHGYDLVDDPNLLAEGYNKDIIWDGLDIIDFHFAPHYHSDHPESHLIDQSIEKWVSKGVKYRALSDGEVIIL